MAIIAQVRAFEHINFNKNCGVDEFTEDFLVSDAAMNPETESGRFACAKRPYGRGRRTRTLNKGFGDPREHTIYSMSNLKENTTYSRLF